MHYQSQDLLLTNGIDIFLDGANYDSIPIIDIVKINNQNYGRLDTIITRYYNGNMEFLPILMSFNKISDPIEIKLGTIIKIPDINFILEQIEINQVLDNNIIPGVNKSMDNRLINSELLKLNSPIITTALPKLKVTLKKVSYDASTGVISY